MDQLIFNLKIKIIMSVFDSMEKLKEIVINIFLIKIHGFQMNIKMEFKKK